VLNLTDLFLLVNNLDLTVDKNIDPICFLWKLLALLFIVLQFFDVVLNQFFAVVLSILDAFSDLEHFIICLSFVGS